MMIILTIVPMIIIVIMLHDDDNTTMKSRRRGRKGLFFGTAREGEIQNSSLSAKNCRYFICPNSFSFAKKHLASFDLAAEVGRGLRGGDEFFSGLHRTPPHSDIYYI